MLFLCTLLHLVKLLKPVTSLPQPSLWAWVDSSKFLCPFLHFRITHSWLPRVDVSLLLTTAPHVGHRCKSSSNCSINTRNLLSFWGVWGFNFDGTATQTSSSSSSSLSSLLEGIYDGSLWGDTFSILSFLLPGCSSALKNQASPSKRPGSVWVYWSQRPKKSGVWVPTAWIQHKTLSWSVNLTSKIMRLYRRASRNRCDLHILRFLKNLFTGAGCLVTCSTRFSNSNR